MWVNLDFFSIYYERQSVKTRKKRDFEQLLQPVKEKHFYSLCNVRATEKKFKYPYDKSSLKQTDP